MKFETKSFIIEAEKSKPIFFLPHIIPFFLPKEYKKTIYRGLQIKIGFFKFGMKIRFLF